MRHAGAVLALALITGCSTGDAPGGTTATGEPTPVTDSSAAVPTDPAPTSSPPAATSAVPSVVVPDTSSPLPSTSTAPPEPTVVRPMRDDVAVHDGDTFSLTVDGVPERVRLIGIDAPEVGECQSDRSTALLEDLLLDASDIVLVPDSTDRDRYGRLLRYVEADGVSVNEVLVRAGLALSRRYPPDTARQDALDRAQAAAEAEQVGLWNPGACGTPSSASLAITAIEADPPGDDTQALTQEYIEITNVGPAPVDLTGWRVKDNSASHRYLFPAGYVLTPGAAVKVRTGCGADSTTDLYWCESGSAVWNNGGDTVYVLDPNGNIAVKRSYP